MRAGDHSADSRAGRRGGRVAALPLMTTQQLLFNGATGTAFSALSVITTFQEQLEWWVRISGGMLGLTIAAITLVRLLFKTSQPPPP